MVWPEASSRTVHRRRGWVTNTVRMKGSQLPKETALLLLALCLVLADPTRAEDWSAWQRAYDPATRTRFIPVELWTGAPWDGTQEIRMAPAALEFGQRGAE